MVVYLVADLVALSAATKVESLVAATALKRVVKWVVDSAEN